MGFVRRHPLWLLSVFLFLISQKSVAADVVLAWDANTEPNIAGYKVYYGTASGFYSSPFTVGPQTTTYTVKGLQSGTWYFSVTALDTSGFESIFSNEVTKIVDSSPPVISAVQAINILSSSATITWTTNEPSDSLVEYGLTTAYGNSSAINGTLISVHSQALTGLSANTLYHYRVQSRDAAGNISISADASFTTSPSADIVPPVISGLSTSGITNSSALVSWTTNEPSDSQVEYGLTSTYDHSSSRDSSNVTTHSQMLSGLNAGTAYHFRVLSRDSAGNLAVSDDATFTTTGLTTMVPQFVQVNSSTITSGNSASISFPASNTAGNLIVAYVVWDNSGPVTVSDSRGNFYASAIGPTKYSGDRANSQVFYATNISGGANTVTVTFSTAITFWGIVYIHEYSGIDPISPVAATTAGSGSSAAMSSGTLNTGTPNALLFAGGECNNTVTGAGTGYTARSTFAGNITEDRVAASSGTYTATATQNGSAWVLQLVAFRAATITPKDTTPPQITAVGATAVTSSGATINWATDELSDSQVEYGSTTAYGKSTPIDAALLAAHTISVSGLSPGTTYHYRVKSKDAAGNLAVSADFSFKTIAVVSAVPKYVQGKQALVSSGGAVSVNFPYSNTVGNLIVAYVIWDNSGPVTVSDSKGNQYASAIGPTKFSGDRTNAQIFYARNILGGANTVKATFSSPVSAWGILYIHEYSGIDPIAPLESAIAGTGSSPSMNSGTLVTNSPNALLFAGGESSGTITGKSSGYTVRSNKYGNVTEDRIASAPGTYGATATQNANAWILQLVAFKAAIQQTAQTTMALPMATASPRSLQAATDSFVGFAVVNSDTEPATLTFTAMDADGNVLEGPGISNPAVRTLTSGEQLRVVDRHLFGEALADSCSGSWIKLESSTSRIKGYYALFDTNQDGYQGTELSAEPLRTVVLPETNPSRSTRFTAINSNPESGIVSFDFVGADGAVRETVDRVIGPHGVITSDSLGQGVGEVNPGSGDYLRIRASTGLRVFEVVGKPNRDFAVVNGFDQGAGSDTLYAPQYSFGPGSRSSLTIINLDSREANVSLRLVGDDARQIGTVRTLAIAANGKAVIEDAQFFQPPADDTRIQGYVEIFSDVRLAGNIMFSDPDRQKSASLLPLVSKLQDTMLLSNMTQDSFFATGITLLNPGDNDITAVVELHGPDGSMIASAADTVSPHQRRSRSIKDYFPGIAGLEWISGYVRIQTSLPIAAFSTTEDAAGTAVSTVPAQDIQ